MSPRALWVHAIVCVLAVVFAWRMAHRVEEKTGGPSSRTLLDAAAGEVVAVEYTWARGTSKLTSAGTGKDRVVTVDLAREIEPPKEKKPAKDAKGDAGPEDAASDAGPSGDASEAPVAPVEKKREEAKFPAGRTVLNGLEALEP